MDSTLFFGVLIFVFAALSAFIGIYVYKDAKARNMDAVLWTLIALLSPYCVGLIIYLVTRSKKIDADSQRDKADLDLQTEKKARVKKRIMAAAAIPLSVFLFSFLSSFFLLTGAVTTVSSTASGSITHNMTLDVNCVSSEVVDWAVRCDAEGKGVYVLEMPWMKRLSSDSQTNEIAQKTQDAYCAYIYINLYKDENPEKSVSIGYSDIDNTLLISYTTTNFSDEDWPGYVLTDICTAGFGVSKLVILIDGEEVEYSFSELP